MKKTPVKPYTIDDLCRLYSITRGVFFAWRKLFIKKLGKLQGRIYTPAQVKIIFHYVGSPDIKPCTINDLCKLYGGISRTVFFSWRILFIKKLGKLTGGVYMPAQVNIIFEHVGFPDETE